jgi:DNA-binding transcriptional MerR regulator
MRAFSIKDLESLSGVKAHTIRMWEQRYGILKPERTDTNIRTYTGKDLKSLLNISLLNEMGYKISRIAQMSDEEIKEVIGNSQKDTGEKHLVNILKIAMLNYDEELWKNAIEGYLQDHNLEQVFHHLFIPFLHQIGLLWQTDAICPAQEHFISSLIRQKLYSEIEKQDVKVDADTAPVVLFLPDKELHDLGLLMLHYIIRNRGKRSIFLGSSVPLDDLLLIARKFEKVHFVSLFTTNPSTSEAPKYLERIKSSFKGLQCEFHISGYSVMNAISPDNEFIKLHNSPEGIISALI